ncbi:phage Gp37/Gp68 family protein [Planktothrix paucivesiculata]|uniref:Phage Gp37Gp68 family protein n=1 Tax=Planktothrix paucivesiculata PCC 9631 TaxID=671071 RepID=A0A7Z9DZ71_9CYAN|nr:phage Gp37/Gp68 family protein [Planktothrix paucivesiculata]VXD17199.1 Phage Gp37Gp68 family protein [Planktothrix paucivesiculata PCC 9631]
MTTIAWTDETINPIVGCSRISAGCQNCYAATAAKSARLQQFSQYQKVGEWDGTVEFVENQLDKISSWKKSKNIFFCSMADMFHKNVPFQWVEKIFQVIEENPQHTYQILTKRPERMIEFFDWYIARNSDHSVGLQWSIPDNVWLGVSAENQAIADKRIPLLMQIPAKVRFLSCEPLLEPLDLSKFLPIEWSELAEDWIESWPGIGSYSTNDYPNWIIVGGESGAGSRPCHVDWIRSIASQAQSAKVPVFIKQLGSNAIASSPYIDGVAKSHYKLKLKDRKGADINEFPEDLRIQQFPS